ncbi:MAG: hypothetical protein Q9208_007363 [Pyrenodesmia sp. 3 TL-2023]
MKSAALAKLLLLLAAGALHILPALNHGIQAPSGAKVATIVGRQQQVGAECHLTVPTNVWTTCQQMLDKYKLPFSKFFAMNPTIKANCEGFLPGTSYCVRVASIAPIPVSTSGECGVQFNSSNTFAVVQQLIAPLVIVKKVPAMAGDRTVRMVGVARRISNLNAVVSTVLGYAVQRPAGESPALSAAVQLLRSEGAVTASITVEWATARMATAQAWRRSRQHQLPQKAVEAPMALADTQISTPSAAIRSLQHNFTYYIDHHELILLSTQAIDVLMYTESG